MPFDTADFALAPAETAGNLYQRRREEAVALWRALPEGSLDMSIYYIAELNRGCAIGHLAAVGHGGWFLSGDKNKPLWAGAAPREEGRDLWTDAAGYFGISVERSLAIFGSRQKTVEEVSAMLLASPVPVAWGEVMAGRWRRVSAWLRRLLPSRRAAAA